MYSIYVYVYVYICMYIFIYVYMYMYKTELTEKTNFGLFAANRKRKRQTSICLLLTQTEIGSLFSLVSKR
jgi:hypothetical protein